MIDGLLLRPVNITLNSRSTQVPTIEAIILQLLGEGREGTTEHGRSC